MSVGYKLYREVRDFAPSDWTSGELIVAWVIADDANDDTRQSWIPLPELCRRTRLAPSSVRAALAKLATRGFEFRVAHGYGKDGRPVFAARNHAVDYLVPDILKGAAALAAFDLEGASGLAPNGHGKALAEAGKALAGWQKGASALAPLSSVSPQVPSTSEAPAVTTSVEDSHATANGSAARQPVYQPRHLAGN